MDTLEEISQAAMRKRDLVTVCVLEQHFNRVKFVVDEGVVCWGNFLLLAHLPLGSSQLLLSHVECVPVAHIGAEMVHANRR